MEVEEQPPDGGRLSATRGAGSVRRNDGERATHNPNPNPNPSRPPSRPRGETSTRRQRRRRPPRHRSWSTTTTSRAEHGMVRLKGQSSARGHHPRRARAEVKSGFATFSAGLWSHREDHRDPQQQEADRRAEEVPGYIMVRWSSTRRPGCGPRDAPRWDSSAATRQQTKLTEAEVTDARTGAAKAPR